MKKLRTSKTPSITTKLRRAAALLEPRLTLEVVLSLTDEAVASIILNCAKGVDKQRHAESGVRPRPNKED